MHLLFSFHEILRIVSQKKGNNNIRCKKRK